MAELQVLLERGELRIAGALEEAGTLVRKLVDVKARMGGAGRVRIGADGGAKTTIW